MSGQYTGTDLSIADVFGTGIPFEGKIDLAYFADLPNGDSARAALNFLSNQPNEFELLKRHSPDEVAALWRATFRACLAHGVGIPEPLQGFARRLGVVLPR